ncbi:hypothetical protein COOONC_28090 [Cooperia oncophora]
MTKLFMISLLWTGAVSLTLIEIDDVYFRSLPSFKTSSMAMYPSSSRDTPPESVVRKVSKEPKFYMKRFLAYKVKKMAARNHMIRLYENINKVLEDSEGIKYTTDSAKAEALADYFASVFEKSPLFPTLPSLSSTHIELPTVSYRKVLRSLSAVKPSLSPTANGYFAVPVTHVRNISLILGQVPKIWKTLMSHPYLKQAMHALFPARPISILPAPLKVIERLVKDELLKWVTKLHLVPVEQHGFIPGASTYTQLLVFTHLD